MLFAQSARTTDAGTSSSRQLGFAYSETTSLAASQYRQRIQNVSLTHLRIQQFLHLNDHHIPLPIIRLYYEELQRDPAAQNKEAIMAYTMLLRDWHMTRNKLNFVRDVTKVALILGKRLSDNLMVVEAALNNLEVTPQDVYESIMSDIHEQAERRNLSLGEYLIQKYNEAQTGQMDQFGRDVSSLQALFPNANVRRRSFWNSFTVTFLLRLCKETLRTVTKLDGKGGDFFHDSEPTWSRRDGTPYLRTSREIAEDAELRRKLMERLLSGEGGGGDNGGGAAAASLGRPIESTGTGEQRGKSIVAAAPVCPDQAINSASTTATSIGGQAPVTVAVDDDDDTYTVDTSTFRECYRRQSSATAAGATHREKRARLEESSVAETSLVADAEKEVAAAAADEERRLNEVESNAERIERALSELNAKPASGVLKDDMFGDEDVVGMDLDGDVLDDGSYVASQPMQLEAILEQPTTTRRDQLFDFDSAENHSETRDDADYEADDVDQEDDEDEVDEDY